MFVEVAALKAADAESWTLRCLGLRRNAMAPPSHDTLKVELLMYVVVVLIFVGSFLALLFSAIFGVGLARLLYVSGCWCAKKIHHAYSLDGTGTMNAFGRIMPHH
jgi:hypothetical protein